MFGYYITGSEIESDILTVLLMSGRTNRQVIRILSKTDYYAEKRVRRLRDDLKLVKQVNNDELVPNIGRLKEVAPAELIQYYDEHVAYSDGYAGRSKAHRERCVRTSEVITMAKRAGLKVGPENIALRDINSGAKPKNHIGEKTLYQNKELRYEKGQLESRLITSRSHGILVTPGITGLIFNTGNMDSLLRITLESEMNIRAAATVRELYEMPESKKVVIDSDIVIYESQQAFQKVINRSMQYDASVLVNKRRMRPLSEIIIDPKLMRASVRAIELSANGATMLQVLTSIPQKMIKRLMLSKSEIERAEGYADWCDGITESGLHCVEYISSNITKLIGARRRLQKIGVVCTEEQRQFLIKCIGASDDGVYYRCIKTDELMRHISSSVLQ